MGMQIKNFNNNVSGLSSKTLSQAPSQVLSFKSDDEHQSLEKAVLGEYVKAVKGFANASDRDIYEIASQEPVSDYHKSAKNLIKTLIIAAPLADVAATAIAKQGNLSTKLATAAKRTGLWAGMFAIGAVVFGIKHAINNNSETLRQADKDYPGLAFVADLGVLGAAYLGAAKGAEKLGNYVSKKYSSNIASFQAKVRNPLKERLNTSNLNTKVVKPIDNKMFAGMGGPGKVAKAVAAFIAPTIMLAALFKNSANLKIKRQEAQENYESLKDAQNQVREHLYRV